MELNKKILGVTGRNGSGKDEVLNYLHDRCHLAVLSAGDQVRKIAREEDVPTDRENLHAISMKYMKARGKDFFARRLIDIIEANKWAAVGISGVRTPCDVEAFRRHFGNNFRLVYVRVGNPELRFQRLRKRKEARDPKTRTAFIEQERAEEKRFNISRTFNQADFTITNDGTINQLHRNIEKSPIWGWICPMPEAAQSAARYTRPGDLSPG
jgi:dephospho-CoA kinase